MCSIVSQEHRRIYNKKMLPSATNCLSSVFLILTKDTVVKLTLIYPPYRFSQCSIFRRDFVMKFQCVELHKIYCCFSHFQKSFTLVFIICSHCQLMLPGSHTVDIYVVTTPLLCTCFHSLLEHASEICVCYMPLLSYIMALYLWHQRLLMGMILSMF